MASFVRNIRIKNYQNLIIGFQVTFKNIRDVFLRHTVVQLSILNMSNFLSNGNKLQRFLLTDIINASKKCTQKCLSKASTLLYVCRRT